MRKWLKRIGITLGVLVLSLVAAGAALSLVGRSRLSATLPPAQAPDGLSLAAASVERGEHVMRIHGCQSCHGEDLGGATFLDIPPGLIVAPNLTAGRGGIGARYGAADYDRAIRYGQRPDGSVILPFMPYRLYNGLSDADAADLAAYLESVPPVDRELPPTKLRFPGYVMMGLPANRPATLLAGLDAPRPPAPPAGETVEFGRYRASTSCVECHGKDLNGGKHPAPEAPPGPGLRHTARWSFDDFARAVRTGQVPGGRQLSEWMPSDHFRHLTDTELRALQLYFGSLLEEQPRTASR